MIIKTTIRMDKLSLAFSSTSLDDFVSAIKKEFPEFLENLSEISTIHIDDIKINGTKASIITYVSLTVEIQDERMFRLLKLKHPHQYRDFLKKPITKPYEIPYDNGTFDITKLIGTYI